MMRGLGQKGETLSPARGEEEEEIVETSKGGRERVKGRK
jgi:hypothetical protein